MTPILELGATRAIARKLVPAPACCVPIGRVVPGEDMAKYEFTPPFGIWDLLLFRAIRLWPHDERLQINFLRHAYRVQESELESSFPESLDMPEVMTHLKNLRGSLGGRATLNDIDSADIITKNILKITNQGQLAGLILTIAYQLVIVLKREDLASWNRITFMIEKESQKRANGWNRHITRSSIVTAWKGYESVAHLWAAHMFFGGYWHKTPPLPADINVHSELELHLALAHTLQKFGTQKSSNRARKSILNSDTVVKIDLPLECDFQVPFPNSWIQTLEKYKAPVDWPND